MTAFRFGMVAAPGDEDPARWRATARRAEELGFDTLLMPDGLQLPSVSSSLAIAAEHTTRLRVGTFVFSSVLRPPGMIAYEAHSLARLTGGRFDLGVGTGAPHTEQQARQRLGEPPLTRAQRRDRVAEAVTTLRELEGDHHTPVMITGSGPRARRLAAEHADIVALAGGPLDGLDWYRQAAEDVRAYAGRRADELELSMNIFVVGDHHLAEQFQRFLGVGIDELIAAESMIQLRGDTDDIVAELERRREQLGVSYFTINEAAAEAFAPVLDRLRGR